MAPRGMKEVTFVVFLMKLPLTFNADSLALNRISVAQASSPKGIQLPGCYAVKWLSLWVLESNNLVQIFADSLAHQAKVTCTQTLVSSTVGYTLKLTP